MPERLNLNGSRAQTTNDALNRSACGDAESLTMHDVSASLTTMRSSRSIEGFRLTLVTDRAAARCQRFR